MDESSVASASRMMLQVGPYHVRLQYRAGSPFATLCVAVAHAPQDNPPNGDLAADRIVDLELRQFESLLNGDELWDVEGERHAAIATSHLADVLAGRIEESITQDRETRGEAQ